MAALRARDGAFLLGEMGGHTMNGGQIYFAAGTPDRNDIFGDSVDLAASAARELQEETGFAPEQAPPAPGWSILVSETKIACIQERLLPFSAVEAEARMSAFIARDPEPEFARFHIVAGPQDIDPARMPDFIQAFLRDALAQPAG
jgi:8-oxo-dGTP pyrophosphatase MutT (NUDIX family)